MGSGVNTAGRSAQDRYETLSARHRAGRRRRLIRNLAIATVVAIGAVIWMGDRYGSLPLLLVGSVYLIAILKAIIEPDHVRAWGIGAEGERVTGRELDRLPDGFRVLHDLRIPGSRANVDHVVIGPTGVFVVESKRMRGKLRVRGEEVIVAGRRRGMVDEVRREVAAVQTALAAAGIGAPVRPILFIQEADPPWFLGKPAGIPIVLNGRKLRRMVTSRDAVLAPAEVERAVDALLQRLGRSASPRASNGEMSAPVELPAAIAEGPVLDACPRCGSEMVLRRNRRGEQFLGCSTFPLCRGTRTWRQRESAG
jgi:hypothetical protein